MPNTTPAKKLKEVASLLKGLVTADTVRAARLAGKIMAELRPELAFDEVMNNAIASTQGASTVFEQGALEYAQIAQHLTEHAVRMESPLREAESQVLAPDAMAAVAELHAFQQRLQTAAKALSAMTGRK